LLHPLFKLRYVVPELSLVHGPTCKILEKEQSGIRTKPDEWRLCMPGFQHFQVLEIGQNFK
jgi:hypothetical protein